MGNRSHIAAVVRVRVAIFEISYTWPSTLKLLDDRYNLTFLPICCKRKVSHWQKSKLYQGITDVTFSPIYCARKKNPISKNPCVVFISHILMHKRSSHLTGNRSHIAAVVRVRLLYLRWVTRDRRFQSCCMKFQMPIASLFVNENIKSVCRLS